MGVKKEKQPMLVKGSALPTPAATTSVAGSVKQSALVANAAGANPTKAEFDALLTALKNAGIMASA